MNLGDARHLARLVPAAALLAATAALAPHPSSTEEAPSRSIAFVSRTMGTYARITIVASDSALVAPHARAAQSAFFRVDSLMSNWTTTSEVARVNREASGRATVVHPEVAEVIAAALEVGRVSLGAFDITVEPLVRAWGFIGGPRRVPSGDEIREALESVGLEKLEFDAVARTLQFTQPGVKIDLGGIAKGHAVDAAAETLRSRGVSDALVDISGNMVPLGAPPGVASWRVGFRDPRDRIAYFARLHLGSDAVATAGNYEQFVAAGGKTYGHIMDPRTGWPAQGLLAVTVIAKTALEADAWDTALLVLGPAQARRLAKARADFSAVLVAPGNGGPDTVWVERDLEGRLVLEEAARAFFHLAYF